MKVEIIRNLVRSRITFISILLVGGLLFVSSQERIPRSLVIVAARALDRGETIAIEDLAVQEVAETLLPGGTIDPQTGNDLLGFAVARPIGEGEPILWSAIEEFISPASASVPVGKRLVTLVPDNLDMMLPYLQVGDDVDLYWRPADGGGDQKSLLLFSKVTVHATDHNLENAMGRISFVLEPKRAHRLLHAVRFGQIDLLIRNSKDLARNRQRQDLVTTTMIHELEQRQAQKVEIIYEQQEH